MKEIIEKAKQGWPVEVYFTNVGWQQVCFVGLDLNNQPVIQDIKTGRLYIVPGQQNIRLVPKKIKGWINIYPPMEHSKSLARVQGAFVFPTKDDADDWAKQFEGRIACVEVEWEQSPEKD